MDWNSLLACLRLQTPHLTIELFEKIKNLTYLFHYPEKLIFEVPNGPLKSFLSEKQFWYEECFAVFEWLQKNNCSFTHYGHDLYPREFYTLSNPPLFLSYIGSPCWLEPKKLSVVGSRYPSAKSLTWMEQNISPLISKNVITVSGAARGIDQKAHSLSLRQKKPTIAFIPSGLAHVYPAVFCEWLGEIKQAGGAVISEYSPKQPMLNHHFYERNRMISALGKCLLVIEARRPSGTLMTAKLAIDNNQTLCVLPGFPDEIGFKGSVDLMFQGAFPVRDALDLQVLLQL